MKNRVLALSLFLLCIITLLPFLGLTEFNTKGEPREAVVAVSMLNQNDWILPVNNGVDIPYKPPFFHWCIAAVSLVQGYVSEFTSRLPSALSMIVMVMCSFFFFIKRKNKQVALIAALLILTSIEVHRAAISCRVDMMLTAFIVGALFLFYKWYERGCKGLPVWAVLCMSGAMFTKGPVGILLPSLVMGIFLLLRGNKFWVIFGKFVAFGLLACILPLLWYVAAYIQGGDNFLDLVMEENFARFMGKMSYSSHEHPFTYNFMTLITGWLPWTLLLVISLFSLHYHKFKISFRSMFDKIRNADSLNLFVWLSFIVILVFYCIPKSKRSVYLLPVYPFMAFLIAEYLVYLMHNKVKSLKIFAGFMSFVAVLVTVVFLLARCGMLTMPLKGVEFSLANMYFYLSDNVYMNLWAMIIPCFLIMLVVSYSKDKHDFLKSMGVSLVMFLVLLFGVFFALNMVDESNMASLGKNADFQLLQFAAVEKSDIGFIMLLLMYLPFIAACQIISVLTSKAHKNSGGVILTTLFVLVFSVFIVLDGFYLPNTMSTRSDRPLAEKMEKKFKGEEIYSYVPDAMLHFFGTDFYIGDKIKQFEVSRPEHGVLMIAGKDRDEFFKMFKDYKFKPVMKTNRRMTEKKDIIYFYRF